MGEASPHSSIIREYLNNQPNYSKLAMPSTTAILPSNNKQITTVTGSKSKECVVKSNNAAEERKKMQDWIKRFDQLFAALVKAENKQMKHQDSQLEFSTTLQITGYETSDVDLVVDTDRKLTVKGRREVTEDDDVYIEEFNEIIDLPDNIDDEEICLIKEDNGYLTITAPILNVTEKENSTENSENLAVANPHDK